MKSWLIMTGRSSWIAGLEPNGSMLAFLIYRASASRLFSRASPTRQVSQTLISSPALARLPVRTPRYMSFAKLVADRPMPATFLNPRGTLTFATSLRGLKDPLTSRDTDQALMAGNSTISLGDRAERHWKRQVKILLVANY